MDQETRWMLKYNEVVAFIETNKRNPSRYNAEERGLYCNWIRHNRKLYNSCELKGERIEKFKELLELIEQNKHKNQYQ